MNKIKPACRISLILVGSLLCIVGCTSAPSLHPSPLLDDPNASRETFVLPALNDPVQREYLGIETTENFALSDIQAQVLIIEVFDFYCIHCQREAPSVNQLYRSITEDPFLRNRIKLIGIGVRNTTYEVNQFRKSFEVLFPLFPDRSRDIARQLAVRQTPTFIGFVWENGTPRQFLHAPGSIGKVDEFLARVVRMAGLEDGQP
jgi:thiol-disulfide isomerase/thioredoxin